MSALEVDLRARAGALELHVELVASDDETVVIVGPNGAGKTTLLRALAGLVEATGTARLDGDDLLTRAPEDRHVGVVFQDHVLFPHLTARENVAFGLRCRGVTRRTARDAADAWLARVGLAGHEHARPSALSGGQAQRVALARALATEPRLLLLDEPMAALDATTRAATRRDLVAHLAAVDAVRVVVTHDPVDAIALGTRVVVLEGGRVVQVGTPDEIRMRPRSRYVADLIGVNLLRGRATAGIVAVGDSSVVAADPVDGEVFVVIHPHAVALHRAEPEGTPRNVWRAVVGSVDPEGDRVRVNVDGPVPLSAEVTAAAVASLGLAPGVEVWASVKATEVSTFLA